MSYTCNSDEWRRAYDDPHAPAAVSNPYRHCYPETREDLIAIVKQAESRPDAPPWKVRACGSHWAFSDAAVCKEFIIETDKLNAPIYEVVGAKGCLNAGAEDILFTYARPPDPTKGDNETYYFFHVQAGMKVFDLYCFLDAGDQKDPRSLAHKYAYSHRLDGPWALPTLGGAGGQTVAGVVSTSTHGGDINLPPVAAAVAALHIIGPGGVEYWFERPHLPHFPLTDKFRLQNAYPGIQVFDDASSFNAALVSVGRFGIIYSVVLRVRRQFALREQRVPPFTWSDLKSWITNPYHPHFGHRFVQIVLNPHEVGGEHSAYLTFRDEVPLQNAPSPTKPGAFLGQEERCGAKAGKQPPLFSGDFDTQVCTAGSVADAVQPFLDKLKGTAESLTKAAFVAQFFEPGVAATLFTNAAAAWSVYFTTEAFVLTALNEPLHTALADICNFLLDHDLPDWVGLIEQKLLELQNVLPWDKTAISYAIMDQHNYADRQCEVWGHSLEVAFNATSPDLVTFLDSAFARLSVLNKQKKTYAGWLSLRWTGSSDAQIAMQRWPRTCHMEFAGLGGVRGVVEYLQDLHSEAVKLGGTIHWGQMNDLTAAEVEKMYPQLDDWRRRLAQITRNGRLTTFSTDFTFGHALEIVDPIISWLEVQPRYCAADEPLTISWDAEDNPPYTNLSLLVIGPQSTQTVGIALPLRGGRQGSVAAGVSQVVLHASATVGGRVGRTSQTVNVTAFDHMPVAFEVPVSAANCVSVDGSDHWVSQFDASAWSATLEAVDVRLSAGSAPLTLRKPGTSDVAIDSAAIAVALPGGTEVKGLWQLIAKASGCVGPPPLLAVIMSIRSR